MADGRARRASTYFGTRAPFLMACRKDGLRPGATADLSRLRGHRLDRRAAAGGGFRWVYEAIGPIVHLQSVPAAPTCAPRSSAASPLVPVWEGEISCRHLGCAVEAFDPEGARHRRAGRAGDDRADAVACPSRFWNDPDGSRYRAAYFDEFPGVWRHGDWITVTERGSCVISGRSDATLNRGGVRIGTAEFYAVVEAMPEVADSVVVHLDEPATELLLFVALRRGGRPRPTRCEPASGGAAHALSPRHVPDRILAVPAIPRTLSGKKLEVPVKRILTGTPAEVAASRGSFADPESLDPFVELAETGEISSATPFMAERWRAWRSSASRSR